MLQYTTRPETIQCRLITFKKFSFIVFFLGSFLQSGSGILGDLRRLNVALTRAKHKLILVGSQRMLRTHEPTAQLLKTLRPEQVCNLCQ